MIKRKRKHSKAKAKIVPLSSVPREITDPAPSKIETARMIAQLTAAVMANNKEIEEMIKRIEDMDLSTP